MMKHIPCNNNQVAHSGRQSTVHGPYVIVHLQINDLGVEVVIAGLYNTDVSIAKPPNAQTVHIATQ